MVSIYSTFLYKKLVKMEIDEKRNHTLTKYASTRGIISKSESDHNPLFCQFNIPHTSRAKMEERQTILILKMQNVKKYFTMFLQGQIFSLHWVMKTFL